MTKSIFSLCRKSLYKMLFESGMEKEQTICPDVREKITMEATKIRDHYNSGGHTVDYTLPTTQAAYIIIYFVRNSYMFKHCLSITPLSEILKKFETLNFVILGCGPAPEMVGLNLFLEEQNLQPSVNFFLYDTKKLWEKTINYVWDEYVARDNRSMKFSETDLFGCSHMDTLKAPSNGEGSFYVFNYVLCQVAEMEASEAEKVGGNLNRLFAAATPGSYILVVDLPSVAEWLKSYFKKITNLETIYEAEHNNFVLDNSVEDVSNFGEFLQVFSPKLHSEYCIMLLKVK